MPSHPAGDPAQDFDALRERYRIERERRSPTKTARAYRDVADGFSHAKILFDQQNGGVLAFEPQQCRDQLVHHCRRQSLGRFVDQ